jgi:hypothetical protein
LIFISIPGGFLNRLKYINWFVKESNITLEDGFPITCYLLDYKIDEDVFHEWAIHIRRHYESDDDLKESLIDTGMSLENYLRSNVIPQKGDPLGSTSRSTDFTEIMISDLVEFVHGYIAPRCKQQNRSGKTQSEHGSDILAYKFLESDKLPSVKDELLVIEVKAELSSEKYTPITNAVIASHEYDNFRHTHTLNYYRKKLKRLKNYKQAREISRFQKKSENDYIITYIAAAINSRSIIPDNIILGLKGENLELRKDNKVFFVHGKKLMDLAHSIYDRCVE